MAVWGRRRRVGCRSGVRAIIPDAAEPASRRLARGFVAGDPDVADHVTTSRDAEYSERERHGRAVSGALPDFLVSGLASRPVCGVSVVLASGLAVAAWNDARRSPVVLVWRMGCIRSCLFVVPLPVSRTSGHEHRK